jgi:pyroglutamyl-peptidase
MTPRILITAFEPYGHWRANSSWLALVELTKDLPREPHVTTRLYPVDFGAVRTRLEEDLAADYDYALHMGQSPGATALQLEAVGINVGGMSEQPPEQFQPLIENGPVAYRSELPLADWALKLREAGIPARISYHAGTFLCNATLYLSLHLARQQELRTKTAFIHLPLELSQVVEERRDVAALPSAASAAAIRLILSELNGLMTNE